jgi:hypothetical protein
MTPLTLFGVLAVTAMLVFYAAEERAAVFVLLFAGACAASSIYGFLQGAWPFGLVEAVWTSVAIRRWRARLQFENPPEFRPIACDMTALAPDERHRYDTLRSRISASVKEATSTNTSFRLRMDDSVSLPDIAEWVSLEHRCCPFLNIAVALQPDETRWVELGGSVPIKEFLRGEFSALIQCC